MYYVFYPAFKRRWQIVRKSELYNNEPFSLDLIYVEVPYSNEGVWVYVMRGLISPFSGPLESSTSHEGVRRVIY